ncbi:MAG: DNA-packaging protein, partial [Lachnoanaerobaculum sp.]|nr:DNA-packaging protein [Lachnoanaerobaculum sp.]
MTVNQKELAECLGVSPRNIRDISRDFGIFEKNESGKYELSTCVKEYIEYKLDLDSSRAKGLNLEALKARHEEIKIQMSLEKLREYKAETHRSEDVEEFLSNMLVSFKNKLSTLPSKLAMEIMGETDTNAAIK